MLPITLSNATIAADALSGTVIGTFSADGVRFQGHTRPEDFLIVGRLLVSTWDGQAMPGPITITVQTPGGGPTSFVITITPAVVVPPIAAIQINGSTSPMTVSAGAAIAATVANGPGNPGDWLGVYVIGSPSGPSNPASWKWLSTDTATSSVPAAGITTGIVHLVVPLQPEQCEVRLFSNNSFTIAAKSAAIAVASGAAAQPIITVTPNTPQVADTAAKGSVVATYSVTMTDGSPFTGTIGFGAPNFDDGGVFALSGSATSGTIIVNPAGPGVGPNLSTITDHVTLVASL